MSLFEQILKPMFKIFFSFVDPVIFIPIVLILVIVFIKKHKDYKNCSYYQITKLPFISVKHDLGRFGEYLTYKYLKKFETYGAKFLFNVYIPKEDGETTEIDVLMINSKGLFVFESKNYSGWIFGNESQKNWYQTLPKGKGKSHKEPFYNPIIQNRSHIKHLEALIGEQIPMHSIIVFSERCTLKHITVKDNEIKVINRNNVFSTVSDICNTVPSDLLSADEITELYNKLYPYTQVNEITKAEHISNIKKNSQPQPIRKVSSTEISVLETKTTETPTNSQPQTNVEPTIVEPDANISPAEIKESNPEPDIQETQNLKCPKCNSDLILRTATRGANIGKQFYGCSNYPKCKYIQNIE